jgi:hypothetical protein
MQGAYGQGGCGGKGGSGGSPDRGPGKPWFSTVYTGVSVRDIQVGLEPVGTHFRSADSVPSAESYCPHAYVSAQISGETIPQTCQCEF